MNRLLNEPVWISNAVRALIALGVGFGLNVTAEQVSLIIVVVDTVIAPILRSLVTPNQLAEHRVAMGGSPTKPLND